jgi:phospholipase C
MAALGRIEHVVVLMLENRSFDHYFGFFKPSTGQTVENLTGPNSDLFNLLDPSAPASGNNPTFKVSKPAPFAVHDKEGPSHSFNSVCVQLCNDRKGPSPQRPVRNNGFVRSYKDNLLQRTHKVDEKVIAEVMASFSPKQLPALNALARNFCLCDHWFCEVPGPTMPNRMFIHAATSEGYVHNAFDRPFTSKTVYELLEGKKLTWATYFHDLNEVLQFKKLKKTSETFRRFDERWASDVAGDKLPHYSFILPRFLNKNGRRANSQHAPEDVRFGEHLIADVYDALAANEALFKKTALVVTYDEHGGFFDHVAPGAAPNPDGNNSPNPDDEADFQVPPFSFDRLGLRVPAVIASPWIPKGMMENRKLQHTSVIKTVTEMFGLKGPLNKRDESAASFADLFQQLDAPRAPSDMPAKLPRPSLTNATVSLAAGVPVDPSEEPLDSLTKEWVRGLAALTGGRAASAATGTALGVMPATQADAAEFVEGRLKAAFGI